MLRYAAVFAMLVTFLAAAWFSPIIVGGCTVVAGGLYLWQRSAFALISFHTGLVKMIGSVLLIGALYVVLWWKLRSHLVASVVCGKVSVLSLRFVAQLSIKCISLMLALLASLATMVHRYGLVVVAKAAVFKVAVPLVAPVVLPIAKSVVPRTRSEFFMMAKSYSSAMNWAATHASWIVVVKFMVPVILVWWLTCKVLAVVRSIRSIINRLRIMVQSIWWLTRIVIAVMTKSVVAMSKVFQTKAIVVPAVVVVAKADATVVVEAESAAVAEANSTVTEAVVKDAETPVVKAPRTKARAVTTRSKTAAQKVDTVSAKSVAEAKPKSSRSRPTSRAKQQSIVNVACLQPSQEKTGCIAISRTTRELKDGSRNSQFVERRCGTFGLETNEAIGADIGESFVPFHALADIRTTPCTSSGLSDAMDIREMDAARALLMGPYFSVTSNERADGNLSDEDDAAKDHESRSKVSHGFILTECVTVNTPSDTSSEPEPLVQRRPRSASETLDYLAALAERERCAVEESSSTSTTASNSVSNSSASSDDDSEAMPPPPPRTRSLRPRSISNPEGMEKWLVAGGDYCPSSSYNDLQTSRRHFVLPPSILEEELKEARVAARHFRSGSPPSIPEEATFHDYSTRSQSHVDTDDSDDLTPEELLRQARSRLLEDLSESSVTGEKGILTLPHALSKYKEVYNQNGRIGIYTPQERAAIIARYHEKRSHRNWNKKIRYNCRKSLADRRLRVKGRFVKRSGDEPLKKSQQLISLLDEGDAAAELSDQDMPDVNDPDAGFAPTADQPFRRLRRSTVT